MHPAGHWHRALHWHRPSRILWFIIGATSGAWFMKNRECIEHYHVKHCMRPSISKEAYPPPQPASQERQGFWRERHPFLAPTQTPEGSVGPAVAPSPSLHVPVTADGWDEEKQRLMNIKQQATNSLMEFSEEGLDSLLTSMESLKTRLAERRAQREKEAREQAEREADFKEFEEWKRERAVQALKGARAPSPEPPKRLV
ncbi:hypothetical protein BDW22DRAFT_1356816 [Trametopsis cervina]|nr:hypothetical protein BDW22DRAFT_1356816 [Trametopsis cervina]